jgi:hypothetical protein
MEWMNAKETWIFYNSLSNIILSTVHETETDV